MLPAAPSSSPPAPVAPVIRLRLTALLVCSTVSTLMALVSLAALVLASRRVRTVPGHCDDPWHCTTTEVFYNPITIIPAIGMIVLLVWHFRTLIKYWRARHCSPPPSSAHAWLAVGVTALFSVPAFVLGGLFLMVSG